MSLLSEILGTTVLEASEETKRLANTFDVQLPADFRAALMEDDFAALNGEESARVTKLLKEWGRPIDCTPAFHHSSIGQACTYFFPLAD